MIEGSWRGVVQVEEADAYASYVRETGFTETLGNAAPGMLRRDQVDLDTGRPTWCRSA